MFKKFYLSEMLYAQEALNIKYNGENWRETVKMGKAMFAFQAEVAEFAEEIRSSWKWWSGKALATQVDRDKATFEFIDAIHFAMVLLLLRNGVEAVVNQLQSDAVEASRYCSIEDSCDRHLYLMKAQVRFLQAIERDNMYYGLIELLNFINAGMQLLGVDEKAIRKAYALKNELNHQRVEGGQLNGTYDKSQETPLTLN